MLTLCRKKFINNIPIESMIIRQRSDSDPQEYSRRNHSWTETSTTPFRDMGCKPSKKTAPTPS